MKKEERKEFVDLLTKEILKYRRKLSEADL